MFLIGLIFLIYFRSNLSISSLHTIIGLKNSSSISLLGFTTLSFSYLFFNSIKSFFNFLFFTFKNWIFCIFVSIFSQYFRFYKLGFPFLDINKKNSIFSKTKSKWYSSVHKNTHMIYITHITHITYIRNSYYLHNSHFKVCFFNHIKIIFYNLFL